MQSRFQQMSDSIITRIDEMGERIDDLEKSVGDLIQQAEEDGKPEEGARPSRSDAATREPDETRARGLRVTQTLA